MKNSQKIFKNLKNNFNTIASHFKHSRKFVWYDLEPFLPKLSKQDKILDLGCGSGRIAQVVPKKNNYLGVDFSKELLKKAQSQYPHANFTYGNIVKKNTWKKISKKAPFNYVFNIATLHHLPQKKHHQLVLKKSFKVLKPNGIMVLSVWNLWQTRFLKDHFKQIPKKIANGSLKHLWLPYSLSDGIKAVKTVQRYHYAFSFNQLKNLILKSGFKILKTQKKGYNYIFKAQKPV